MREKVLLLIFVCFNLVVVGQNRSSTTSYKSDTLKAQIKLVQVEMTPHCGIFSWIAAQKFELL